MKRSSTKLGNVIRFRNPRLDLCSNRPHVMSANDPIADIETNVDKAAMSNLHDAVANVRDGSSLYWAFYHPEDRQADPELIEVRLNATPEIVGAFVAPEGWQVERVRWGDTLFLRRHQSLEPEAVEAMLIELLELAAAKGMHLHSWLHGPDAD